jgi:hypothetical protein
VGSEGGGVGFCLVIRRRGREEKTRGQSTLLIYSFSFLSENRAVTRYNHKESETLLSVLAKIRPAFNLIYTKSTQEARIV